MHSPIGQEVCFDEVCRHSCDITQILMAYGLSDVHFDWLVGNMSVYQENLF